MQNPIKERIVKLREEIAEISEANRLYLQGGKKIPGDPDHERRLKDCRGVLFLREGLLHQLAINGRIINR